MTNPQTYAHGERYRTVITDFGIHSPVHGDGSTPEISLGNCVREFERAKKVKDGRLGKMLAEHEKRWTDYWKKKLEQKKRKKV